MKQSLAVLSAALFVLAATGSAFARPESGATCPILKDKVAKPDIKNSSVYRGKTFYFCCGGCKPAFGKMSDKDKVALMKYGVDAKKPGGEKPAKPFPKHV